MTTADGAGEGAGEGTNAYRVSVDPGERGWQVLIADPSGSPVWARSCSGEAEARTLASTIQQHVYWLSPAKFREYYKIAEPG
jgi:hypothetical protein